MTPDLRRRTVAGRAALRYKPIAKPFSELRLDGVDLTVTNVSASVGSKRKDAIFPYFRSVLFLLYGRWEGMIIIFRIKIFFSILEKKLMFYWKKRLILLIGHSILNFKLKI